MKTIFECEFGARLKMVGEIRPIFINAGFHFKIYTFMESPKRQLSTAINRLSVNRANAPKYASLRAPGIRSERRQGRLCVRRCGRVNRIAANYLTRVACVVMGNCSTYDFEPRDNLLSKM